jgi:hypothetical protein
MHPPPPLRRALPLALLLAAAIAAPARAEDPPTDAGVRALMQAVETASRARDPAALAALLAPDCRIELRAVVAGREQLTLFTREEYVAMLSRGYAAMKDLEDYDYRVSGLAISYDLEPVGATVTSDVRESFVFNGRHVATLSHETARIERRDGALLLVAVSDETVADH